MNDGEHIIQHDGYFFVGTISDYIHLCQIPFEPIRNPNNFYLRRASAEEIIEYQRKRGLKCPPSHKS